MELRKSRFIRMGSKVWASVIIGALVAVMPVSPSSAVSRQGSFSCTANAARTQTLYQPSNPAYSPCKDDANWFAQLQPILGLGNLGAVRTYTDQQPDDLTSARPRSGDYATAYAEAAGVNLDLGNGIWVRTGALWSRSTVVCARTLTGPRPQFSSAGSVVTVNLNGKSYGTTGNYIKLAVPGYTIEINKVITTSTSKTRQALVITRTSFWGSFRIIVGESKVGVSGNPCK